jgi:DNA-binding winged helix-turn-helix (wHTH) protein
VLLLLIAKPGHLVSRRAFLEEFYGEAWADVDTTGLSQHLARLRRKIGYERIETVPRFGFKFRGSVRVV